MFYVLRTVLFRRWRGFLGLFSSDEPLTRWLCEESLKTPSSRPILIYFEFRRKPSLITHYCQLNGPSLAQKIHCDKILFSHTRTWYQFLFLSFFVRFFIFRFYVMLFILILSIFAKIVFDLLFFLLFIIIINIVI